MKVCHYQRHSKEKCYKHSGQLKLKMKRREEGREEGKEGKGRKGGN